jgi:hypothetical protein
MALQLEMMWRDLHLVILLDTTSEPGRTNPKARLVAFRRFDVPRLVRWPPKDGQPEPMLNETNVRWPLTMNGARVHGFRLELRREVRRPPADGRPAH